MTFRAWFYRTDPQNIGGQFGKLLGLFEKHFSKANELKKSPEIYFGPKSFRTIFEKRTPDYSLAAPPLGLVKSIYYGYKTRRQFCDGSLQGKEINTVIKLFESCL